jgi:hypothetical protein
MKYFLHLETDISKENKEGETPLLYACYWELGTYVNKKEISIVKNHWIKNIIL